MLKILINIFIVYLLVITVKPCMDEFAQCRHSLQGVHVENTGHEDEHSDECSPLCSCLCCNMSITNPQHFVFELYNSSFSFTQKEFTNLIYLESPPVSPPPKS